MGVSQTWKQWAGESGHAWCWPPFFFIPTKYHWREKSNSETESREKSVGEAKGVHVSCLQFHLNFYMWPGLLIMWSELRTLKHFSSIAPLLNLVLEILWQKVNSFSVFHCFELTFLFLSFSPKRPGHLQKREEVAQPQAVVISWGQGRRWSLVVLVAESHVCCVDGYRDYRQETVKTLLLRRRGKQFFFWDECAAWCSGNKAFCGGSHVWTQGEGHRENPTWVCGLHSPCIFSNASAGWVDVCYCGLLSVLRLSFAFSLWSYSPSWPH